METNRRDVFFSFHGGEQLPFDEDSQARTVCEFIREHVIENLKNEWMEKRERDQGNLSIFFDKRGTFQNLREIMTELLQTRGGGVVICILTKHYFERRWCRAELETAAAFYYHGQAKPKSENLRLHLMCLDVDKNDILENHAFKATGLSEHIVRDVNLEAHDMDPGSVARAIIKGPVRLLKRSHCVPGFDRNESYANLLGLIGSKWPTPGALAVKLRIRGRFDESVDVLRRADEQGAISRGNIDLLLSELSSEGGGDFVKSYSRKWLDDWTHKSWGRLYNSAVERAKTVLEGHTYC